MTTHRNNTHYRGKGALNMSVIARGSQAMRTAVICWQTVPAVLTRRVPSFALSYSGQPQIA
jgi:hypothetical protein